MQASILCVDSWKHDYGSIDPYMVDASRNAAPQLQVSSKHACAKHCLCMHKPRCGHLLAQHRHEVVKITQ